MDHSRTIKTFFYNKKFSIFINHIFIYSSAFVPQRNSYYVHNDTDTFFLFFLQLNFDIFLGPFFVFFYFRKILISFTCFFLELSLVLLKIVIYHFYIWKKQIIKHYLCLFFTCFKNYVSYMSYVSYMNNL